LTSYSRYGGIIPWKSTKHKTAEKSLPVHYRLHSSWGSPGQRDKQNARILATELRCFRVDLLAQFDNGFAKVSSAVGETLSMGSCVTALAGALLLYGCDKRILWVADLRELRLFKHQCLRIMTRIRLKQRICSEVVGSSVLLFKPGLDGMLQILDATSIGLICEDPEFLVTFFDMISKKKRCQFRMIPLFSATTLHVFLAFTTVTENQERGNFWMTKASNLTNDRNNSFLLSKTSNNSCASEQKELGAKHVKGCTHTSTAQRFVENRIHCQNASSQIRFSKWFFQHNPPKSTTWINTRVKRSFCYGVRPFGVGRKNGCNLFRSLPLIVRTRVADELLYSNLQMNPAFVATVTWVRRRTPLTDRLMPLSSCKHKCERNGLGLLPGLGFANTSLMRYVSKTTVVEDLKENQLRCPKRLRLTMIHQNGPFS
ncbi:hypothetical protein CLF_107190, partial [Clonorchis sinensis]